MEMITADLDEPLQRQVQAHIHAVVPLIIQQVSVRYIPGHDHSSHAVQLLATVELSTGRCPQQAPYAPQGFLLEDRHVGQGS